jgi:uncharacterized membrane protein
MYIVAIAWVYVTLMMAITEESVVGGVLTFVFYGLAPLALFLWVFGTPARRRRARARAAASVGQDEVRAPDRADAGQDEAHLLERGGESRPLVQPGNQVGDGDIDHVGRRDAEQHRHP